MSFQPVVLGQGLNAWRFLQATKDAQTARMMASPQFSRDSEHFRQRFPELSSAGEIVGDRRVLRVVLGAYGLSDDIENRFFIRKVLEEGVASRDALANKLTDHRYRALAKDLDFSDGKQPQANPQLVNTILSRYRDHSFEAALDQQDETLRLAMNFQRELPALAGDASSNDAGWFRVLGTPPLRMVIEGALGLPPQFGQLDVDDQLARIKAKATRLFGSGNLSELARDHLDEIGNRFILRSQISSSQMSSPAQNALVLLGAR